RARGRPRGRTCPPWSRRRPRSVSFAGRGLAAAGRHAEQHWGRRASGGGRAGRGGRRVPGGELAGRPGVARAGATDAQRGVVGAQVMRRRAGDAGGDDVAGARTGPVRGEVHQAVIPGTPGHAVGRGVLAALTLGDEDLDDGAVLLRVLFGRDLLDEGDEAVVALLHDRLRHLAGHRRGRGARGIEYWKENAEENLAWRTTSRVPWKSSSVSPGNPTMMSVVIAACGMRTRTLSRIAR